MKSANTILIATAAVFALTVTVFSADCSSDKTCPNSDPDGGFVKIFNGKNLDGWHKFIAKRGVDNDPLNVFSVENSVLKISGEEWGCITTEKEFENYIIAIEFKWGEKTFGNHRDMARDSGFLFSSNGKDGSFGAIWTNSIEVNICKGGTGDFWMVTHNVPNYSLTSTASETIPQDGKGRIFLPNGKAYKIKNNSDCAVFRLNHDPDTQNVKGFHSKNEFEAPHGEWNSLVCEIKNGNIKVFLNGAFINEANFSPTKGKIQIQSEGSEIFYRRIDVKPL